MKPILLSSALLTAFAASLLAADPPPPASEPVQLILKPYWDSALPRAGRVESVCVRIENPADKQLALDVTLTPPAGMKLLDPATQQVGKWEKIPVYATNYNPSNPFRKVEEKNANATVIWRVEAIEPLTGTLVISVKGEGVQLAQTSLPVDFAAALEKTVSPYVPTPVAAETDYLIGAQYFPGWRAGEPISTGWSPIEPYPERKPALGWYDEDNPEVTDWEIKYALEHGINFFLICWYRGQGNAGKPVEHIMGHSMDNFLNKAKFRDDFKVCLSWENYSVDGVSDENDLLNNLLPYWIENYFKKPGYLKVDNKPVVSIYALDKFVAQLGGTANARSAVAKMNDACKAAGFAGILLISEYRGIEVGKLQMAVDCGMDASYAYCYGIDEDVSKDDGEGMVMNNLNRRVKAGLLPIIPTLPHGWGPQPWIDYTNYPFGGGFWRVGPPAFRKIAAQIKELMDSQPKGSLQSRMLLLDNWNEWGEGHYLAPCREHGFAYLDIVRDIFCKGPSEHVDLVPEDAGRGPYDAGYRSWLKTQK